MKLILDERGKKYILKAGEQFESDLGILSSEDLDNAEIGDEIKSHLGHSFKIIKPNINDFIDVMDRRCSILLKKDIGYVLAHTGLGAGDRVVDAGTGAGAIALNFGNVVGPEGHVYTYEIRPDFAEVAQKNIDKFGIENIKVKNQNVKEGIEEDGISLLDFKTDYVTEETIDAVALGYRMQVLAYASALERIYCKPIKKAQLYFFRLNRFISVL